MSAKKILIIDDDEDILEVAQLTFEAVSSWQVFTATSGDEGIFKAQAEQPDAILLDVMMPEMDGVATFDQLQGNASTENIPVVLLTAKLQSMDKQRFANLKVAGMIPKPFDPMKLTNQVEEILGWKC
ncbi:response regulator [Mastigocoleus testarum]|uniref:Two-component system response regulator n=1 Tax=Mastigocoleus testarum BC008 TaxID=371196 RepID=A0A0V7ZMW9_9CYAN|nr:response regulator [Mastigocoleus testarum]KST65869.1 two-component system response regulator [Mastigocoleus testarum BC008]